MPKWDWLEKPAQSPTWGFMLRVIVKAGLLFVLLNLLFAVLNPLDALGRLSLYNTVLPGRERLPYGETGSHPYNLTLDNIPAMFTSHAVSQSKADDEFRVLLIGDSASWGWLLDHDQTLTAYINTGEYHTEDGRRVVAYNLGYPIMSLTKDLILLDEAMRYEPDLIVWAFTAESFPRQKQLFPPIIQNNAERLRHLIATYELDIDPNDARLNDPDFMDKTLIGRRRELADLVRLQSFGFSWASTGIDQIHNPDYTPTAIDQSDSLEWTSQGWDGIAEPRELTEDDLVFDVLRAGIERAGDVPVLLVNEPMLVSEGENSDVRYNAFYPRWAYDAYRQMLIDTIQENEWLLLDMWDYITQDEFTDSPVHMTSQATQQTAEAMIPLILKLANESN